MQKFKFKTSATEGSIHNYSDWDYVPRDAREALDKARAKIKEEMKSVPESATDEEWEKKYWSLRNKVIQVMVTEEGNHFRSQATEQVNTGIVELTINL